MTVLVVVEEPCHEHFHDQEDQDGSDVVLHSQDVVSVHPVHDSPTYRQQSIDQGSNGIEWEFCNLSSWQFTKGIAELDDSIIAGGTPLCGADAVISSPFDGVVDSTGVFEMDRFGSNEGFGLCGCVGFEDESS